MTREKFEQAVAAGTAESVRQPLPVAAGDSVLVHSGLVHAIDGGNLILEIQQNSDTTYRVHDWGRAGLDGKPRRSCTSPRVAAVHPLGCRAAAGGEGRAQSLPPWPTRMSFASRGFLSPRARGWTFGAGEGPGILERGRRPAHVGVR